MIKDCGQKWWKDAKYGLFIHWGLYSVLAGSYKGTELPGIGEWIMKRLNIPVAEYEKIASEFNPVNFNAAKWVQLAKEAGMKYLVYTAKHHDGFAMYHSDCSRYNIVDATPFGRDPVKELAEECKKAGIALCFYYSQAQDWHDPDGYGYGPIPDEKKNFRRYLDEKCKPQLRELLTKYGHIGLIWFDTPQIMSYEHSKELKDYVKSIQPNCIVSGRIGNQLGEYMSTGDNRIPINPFNGDWEVPATINDTWGFKTNDHNWKSPQGILELMLKINSRGGNYLLNIGPDGLGDVPQPSIDVLRKVGEFLKANGEAVYGTRAVWGYPYDIENFILTSKDYHLYLNFVGNPGKIHLTLLDSEVKKVTMLATGEEIPYELSYAAASKANRIIMAPPNNLPCELYNTIDIEIADKEPAFGRLEDL
jgi:alpha-L-fucosidase